MRACTAMHRHAHTHVRKWQLFLSAIPTEMGIYFFSHIKNIIPLKTLVSYVCAKLELELIAN